MPGYCEACGQLSNMAMRGDFLFVLLSCPRVPVSAQGETLVFPQAIALLTPSTAEPLQQFLHLGSSWQGESIEPHVRVKGRRRKSDFPQDLGVLVRFFFSPLLLAVSVMTA